MQGLGSQLGIREFQRRWLYATTDYVAQMGVRFWIFFDLYWMKWDWTQVETQSRKDVESLDYVHACKQTALVMRLMIYSPTH